MADDLALDTLAEADATPEKALRRWLLEIKLAQKREREWRNISRDLLKTYRGTRDKDTNRKKNTFNILWSNTELLRPTLYNSTPKPDVRRRFRQSDALGKAVGEVAERALSFCIDAYDMDNCIKNDVLDAVLPGRGISRVRYVPIYKAKAGAKPSDDPQVKEQQEVPHDGEAYEGNNEEVEYEQALCEHIQWDDFIHGPGKTWEEVCWTGFRVRLTKDDLVEKFGTDTADLIKLDDVDDSDVKDGTHADDLKEAFKRAELWEIWDKDGGKVFFINESYKKGPLYPTANPNGKPPLKLKGFFPVPRPLMMVEDTSNLVPIPLYELYRKQAEELDDISGRINRIIRACRVRFVHDPTLTELKSLMEAGDNEGIPAESARAFMNNGGLDKAIWWMPVDQIAKVLNELYNARNQAKEVIYEITGISDILRGATDPNETLGAQKMKANSASLRMQRMQREVQRYVRDLIRMLGEVIGENFSTQTLGAMTGLQFPTGLQKQQGQLQMQAAQGAMQQNPQIGQQLAPKLQQLQQMLSMPSWDDIMGVLKSDMQREFRVDIETDSTIAESLQQDMSGLQEVLTGIVNFWQGVGPAVQAGAVSMDAVKAITISIVRHARMGLEIEDALETGMQQPKPQSDPKAAAEAAQAQQEQALAQQQAAHEQQIAAREQQFEEAKAAQQAQLDQQQSVFEAHIKAQQDAQDDKFNRWQVIENNAAKIKIAEIAAGAVVSKAQVEAANAAESDTNSALSDSGQAADAATATTKKRNAPIDKLAEMHQQALNAHGKTVEAVGKLAEAIAKPRKRVIQRGTDGKAVGMVETTQ